MTTAAPSQAIPTYRLYIDGAWTAASGGATYGLVNPATEGNTRVGVGLL